MATVLIKLSGGEGVIRQDDGEIELTHDVTADWGQPLQPWDRYKPARLGLGDDRVLFGGLLPSGAVSVEAVEATGVRRPATVAEGAWAVILEDGEHGDPVLGYRDAEGAFVHRPMPDRYEHEPITDAQEPCPVCGQIEYEQYFVTEEWRAGRGRKGTDSFEPSPLIVCRVCGHQEHIGGIIRFARSEDAEEDEATRTARLAHLRVEQAVQRGYSDKMTLMGVTFPIYAVEGWPARINASGSRGDDLTQLTVAHTETWPDMTPVARPSIEVTTSIDPHQPGELTIARKAFANRITSDTGRELADGLSDAAITLWFRAARRRRVAASHTASVGETDIMIDGAREPFVMVGDPAGLWVAVRRHHGLTITIAARGIEPASLVLEPIADPFARLLTPEPNKP
jgi:hypothetical protein